MARRTARILMNAATVLSLLLCVLAIVAWARGYRRLDSVTLGRRHLLSSWLGGLHYYALDRGQMEAFSLSSMALPPGLRWDGGQYVGSPRHEFHGFIIVPSGQMRLIGGGIVGPPLPSYTAVRVPAWAAVAAMLVLPCVRLGRRQWAGRRRCPGHCPTCGYDLRATPERCPECGTVLEIAGRKSN
jgi:hypothetical protein